MANNLVVQLLLKTGQFSTDLKSARGQIQNFQKSCDTAGKTLGAFGNSLGINVGALGRMSGAMAAAAAAGKVLKDSFKSNTDAMDTFKRESEVIKSVYKDITSQLFKNGNMTIDFGGVAQQAREYYDALDNAGVAATAITTQLRLQQVEYDTLYATAMDVSLSEVDRLEALNEATVVLQKQVKLKRQMAQVDKLVAKEGLEKGLVSSGINKQWLEGKTGQNLLKELLQFDEENNQFLFDTYFKSVNTNTARTAGHQGAYGRAIEQSKTNAGYKALVKQATDKGYTGKDKEKVNKYLADLKAQEEKATSTINDTKYQLAQALHNLRGSTEGYETISKYILLYLNDMGLGQVESEYKSAKAMIERLRKRITGKDGKTINYKEGSIGKVEELLAQKRQELKEATAQTIRDDIKKEIDALTATLVVMNGGEGGPLSKGSQEWLNSEIQKLEEQISKLDLGLPDTAPILQRMNDWEGSWESFVESLSAEELELFRKFEENMKKRWDIMNTKLGYETALSASQGNKTKPSETEVVYQAGSYGAKKQDLEKRIKDVKSAIMGGVNISNEDLQKKIQELKGLEKQLDDLEIQFGFKSTISTATSQWDEFNNAMANTSTIVSSLTNTFKEGSELTAASVLQMVSTCLPALGSLISAISALTTAEAVEAGVGAVGKAVSTSKHWIEAIAAVASIGAVVAAAISSAKNQSFATGGIVGGTSFTGDRVTANVNSGEMILNKSQQARLFKMANGDGTQSSNQVEFHISGTDLVGVLNNNNRKNRVIR